MRFTRVGDWVRDEHLGIYWSAGEADLITVRQAQRTAIALSARLPTIEELFRLADLTRREPAIDIVIFSACRSGWYWSSTPNVGKARDSHWGVDFATGKVSWSLEEGVGFGRYVRSL